MLQPDTLRGVYKYMYERDRPSFYAHSAANERTVTVEKGIKRIFKRLIIRVSRRENDETKTVPKL